MRINCDLNTRLSWNHKAKTHKRRMIYVVQLYVKAQSTSMGEATRMSFSDDSCEDYRAMIENITKNKITFSLSQSL